MSLSPSDPSQPENRSPNLPAAKVREQLEKILATPDFQRSPMLGDFLRFVVEKTLAGCAQEIKGYTVATEVMGRKPDFDGAKDTIVRIQGSRLRRALEHYYLTLGRQDPIRIDIPKGSYVPIIQPAVPEQELPPPPVASVSTLPPGPSVAVLPLLNLTGDPQQEFFAAGLTEEITHELARYQNLRVISFQSALRWQGRQVNPSEMGRALNLRFFLEGSLRREAKILKITVRLVDSRTGLQVWGEQYQGRLSPAKLISFQEEIAQQIAARIGSEYGIISRQLSQESRKKPPESLDTYEVCLGFYYHIKVLTPATFVPVLRGLERAVTQEPDCGLAWSMLAHMYCMNYALQFAPQVETPLEKALIFARKGVALEPRNQQVRTTMAALYFHLNDLDQSLLEMEQALALNPHSPLFISYLGWLLALTGEWDRGLAILRKGLELNPYYPGWLRMAPCLAFYRLGQDSDALREAYQFQMPQLFWDPLLRAAVLGRLQRQLEAAQTVAELLRLKPGFPTQGRFLIGCYVKSPQLAADLLAGLRLAGLTI